MKDKGYHAVFDFHAGADGSAVDSWRLIIANCAEYGRSAASTASCECIAPSGGILITEYIDASTPDRLSVNRAFLRNGFLQGEVPSEFTEIGAVGKTGAGLIGVFRLPWNPCWLPR